MKKYILLLAVLVTFISAATVYAISASGHARVVIQASTPPAQIQTLEGSKNEENGENSAIHHH